MSRPGKSIERSLMSMDALIFLQGQGLPILRTMFAGQMSEALHAARKIGFPVVLKISSPHIVHKTDVNGVLLDLRNELEVQQGFERLHDGVAALRPDAMLEGVVVQEMGRGTEIIIGALRDPQFGPCLMVGLGGIFVEVMRDVAFRVVPIERKDARQMITELKGFPILGGARGRETSVEAIESLLVQVSSLVNTFPEIAEMDLNPVFVNAAGCWLCDARIMTAD